MDAGGGENSRGRACLPSSPSKGRLQGVFSRGAWELHPMEGREQRKPENQRAEGQADLMHQQRLPGARTEKGP